MLNSEGKEEVLLDGVGSGLALSWLWGPSALNEWPANRCSISSDLSSMGWFEVHFQHPTLADKDGIATEKYPADNDERLEMNVETGELKYGSTDVLWCALPQELDTSCSEGIQKDSLQTFSNHFICSWIWRFTC